MNIALESDKETQEATSTSQASEYPVYKKKNRKHIQRSEILTSLNTEIFINKNCVL